MIWRFLALFSLLVVCGCSAANNPESASSYRLEVRQIGSQAAEPPLIMSCADATLCQGQTRIELDNKLQTVTVVALASRGAAYLKFSIGEAQLFSGSHPYVYVSEHSEIILHDKLPQSYFEDREGVYQRPVFRSIPPLAKLSIDINPASAD